jgi:hypothetical protein
MIAMLEELRRSVRFSGAGRALTDALLVRLARMRAWAPIEQLLSQLPTAKPAPVEKKKPPTRLAPRPEPPLEAPAGGAREGRERPAPARRAPRPVAPVTDEPPPDYTGVGTPEDYEPVGETDQAWPIAADQGRVVRTAVTAEERVRILKDPLVQQTIELFDGAVVNIVREKPAAAPETIAQPPE